MFQDIFLPWICTTTFRRGDFQMILRGTFGGCTKQTVRLHVAYEIVCKATVTCICIYYLQNLKIQDTYTSIGLQWGKFRHS